MCIYNETACERSWCKAIQRLLISVANIWKPFFSTLLPPPPSLCSCLLFSRHTLKAFFSRVCMFVIECTCYIKEYLIRMMRPSECDNPNVVTKWMGTNNLKWHHIGLHGRFRSNLYLKKKQTIDIKVALNQCNFHTFHRLNVQKYHEWNAQKLHPIPKIWI